MKIVVNKKLCYACRTCQLACSFHHTNAFWPNRSSITISRNTQNGVVEWGINSTCDGCKDEDIPLCIKYCVYGALGLFKEGRKEKKL